jgi:hypothetical protein
VYSLNINYILIMKKKLLVLMCLLFCTQIAYSSFPISEYSSSDISNSSIFQMDKDDNEPSLIQYILRGVLFFSIVGFGLYFLIKSWLKAWKDDIRWVKILTYVLLGSLFLLLIFFGFLAIIGYGYGN